MPGGGMVSLYGGADMSGFDVAPVGDCCLRKCVEGLAFLVGPDIKTFQNGGGGGF